MFASLRRWILKRFWYVHPPVTLLVRGDRATLIDQLQRAAKPSRDQLHLQDVFRRGRRYQVSPEPGGFSIVTTSRSYWRYTEGVLHIRRRTRTAAKFRATVIKLENGLSRVETQLHIRLGYLMDVLWIPLFFATILVAMPWAWWVVATVIALLFGLSFGYHYFQAAYQANEIVFFLHRALKEQVVLDVPELPPTRDEVVYINEKFETEWERFYRSHSDT